jgi:formate/nitrite transporter
MIDAYPGDPAEMRTAVVSGTVDIATMRIAAQGGVREVSMTAREPQEIAQVATEVGAKKTRRSWDRVLVSSFLAGAYIAFGGMVAITVSSGLDPETWGTLPTLFTGAAFTLGLVLVVIAGSDLATGNMMLVPLGAMRGRIGLGDVGKNLTLVLLGNLVGALFVAYFLAVQSGVIGGPGAEGAEALTHDRLAAIAAGKALDHTAWETFLRAVGCNWLVCLAVWMTLAAESVSGKILAIFFPIMAFVAMGFDHVVANMFFLPAAIFAGVDGLGWGDTLVNWLLAGLGNLVGAVVFVATSYWYLFLRNQPDKTPATSEPAERA